MLEGPIRYASDYHATITMPHQDRTRNAFVPQNTNDICNVCVQINVWPHQMRTFAQARQRWRVDLMTSCAQQRCEALPAPAAMPATVYQYKACHVPMLCESCCIAKQLAQRRSVDLQ